MSGYEFSLILVVGVFVICIVIGQYFYAKWIADKTNEDNGNKK